MLVIPRKSENLQNQRKTTNLAPFVPFSLSLLIPPEPWSNNGKSQEFFDKFKAGLRTHNARLILDREALGVPKSATVVAAGVWVLPGGLLQERPLQFQHGNVRVKSWQPMSNSWSTSSQPDFARPLGRRKTVRNRQGKILYTELLKSWPTLGQLLANAPPHGKLQGSSLR